MQIINNAPSYSISHHEAVRQQSNNGGIQPEVEESDKITVRFMTVSAVERVRMVIRGELPPTVHDADVYMQNANNEPNRVSIF